MRRPNIGGMPPRPRDAWSASMGARIRQKREEKGLSQESLAALLGVTQAQVSLWESGRSKVFAFDLWRLGMVLDVDVRVLLGEQVAQAHKSRGGGG